MKKSKFQELVEKSKATINLDAIKEEPAITPEMAKELFGEDFVTKPEPVVENFVEDIKEVEHTGEVRKAYNIWFDKSTKVYMQDVITYSDSDGISIETTKLTNSQAIAMKHAKEIFAKKLILRKEGI